jgi:hypothetical protein
MPHLSVHFTAWNVTSRCDVFGPGRHLLNATHDYKWTVDGDGAMDISAEVCHLQRFTQFEAQAKNADSEALTALVRIELGAGLDDRSHVNPAKLSKL